MENAEKRLLRWFSDLNGEGRAHLLAFAEFLHGRHSKAEPVISEPLAIPRPVEESVVKSIRRLAATYPMLDNSKMLHETSMMMSQHVMQGRPAAEVIDDLELLFRRHFERWSEERAVEAREEASAADGVGG